MAGEFHVGGGIGDKNRDDLFQPGSGLGAEPSRRRVKSQVNTVGKPRPAIGLGGDAAGWPS